MALLAAAAAVFVLSPLRRPLPPAAPAEGREALLRAREAAYQALREAEFDHDTGKISDADYADLRTRHETRAMAILRRLDALDPRDAILGSESASRSEASDRGEQA
jgi:hypothetical protein